MLESIVAIAAFLLDRATKLWVVHDLQPLGQISFLPGILDLSYTENRGAAFSILWGQTWLFVAISVVVISVLIFYLIRTRKEESVFSRICLACIVGGAVGNLVDRIVQGYVIDFFRPLFIHFAVFNVADIFITVGAALYIAALLWPGLGKKKAVSSHE